VLSGPMHVRTELNVRSRRDARRRVNRHIFSYFDNEQRGKIVMESGVPTYPTAHTDQPAEYRVAFESSRQVTNIRTAVPQQGTSTLDILRQWNERTGRV
jgi:hypothetical protein